MPPVTTTDALALRVKIPSETDGRLKFDILFKKENKKNKNLLIFF